MNLVSRMVVMVLVLAAQIPVAMLHSRPALAATAPIPLYSNYVKTSDLTSWQGWGCDQATWSSSAGQNDGLLVLDFGRPDQYAGLEGALLFDNEHQPWSNGGHGVQEIVANFITGYWNCRNTSNWPHLRLAIGTNNLDVGGNVTQANAAAMGQMITNVYNWLVGNGWANLIRISGAIDTELACSTPSTATAYFSSLAAAEADAQIYDYGDAAGCPTQGFGTCCPIPNTQCQNPWGQGDVYSLAWGAKAAYALPEIYTTSGSQAQQWFYLSEWGVQNQSGKYIWFSGALTQYRACQQVGCPPGTNNLPADGWGQLDWWINTDSRTAMTPPYSSDIRYLPPG